MKRDKGTLAQGRPQIGAGAAPGVLQCPTPLDSLRASHGVLTPGPFSSLWIPLSFCLQTKIYIHQRASHVLVLRMRFITREGIHQAYLCLSTTGVHSFLVSESSSPKWMSIASPQAAPASFPRRCRSVSARTTFRQGRKYSVSRSPRTRNALYLTHCRRPDSTTNPAYYRQAGSVTRR